MTKLEIKGTPGAAPTSTIIENPFNRTTDDVFLSPETPTGALYRSNDQDWSAPPSLIDPADKSEIKLGNGRKAKPSLFNRYSVFFFNNTQSSASQYEGYLDSPNRIDKKT
jgi:hypothetical protein